MQIPQHRRSVSARTCVSHSFDGAQRRLRRFAQAALFGMALCSAAQSMAEEAVRDPSQLPEVVVSARKRLESAVDVPVSITSFSEQSLQNFQIEKFADYADKVSNLSYTAGAGSYGLSDGRSVADRCPRSSLLRFANSPADRKFARSVPPYSDWRGGSSNGDPEPTQFCTR